MSWMQFDVIEKYYEAYLEFYAKRARRDAIAIYCLCGLLIMACGYITYLAR